MKRNKKIKNNNNNEMQKWECLGFTDKHHYQGWLHFNGLVEETYSYDDTWYDEYTGTIVTITGEEVDSEKEDEEYVKNILQGKVVESED